MRCPTGEARITTGANLPAKHVIHTVGPVYHGAQGSAPLLEAAYRNSLKASGGAGSGEPLLGAARQCGVQQASQAGAGAPQGWVLPGTGTCTGACAHNATPSCLQVANEHRLRRVAFPAISCGVFHYPLDEAAEVRAGEGFPVWLREGGFPAAAGRAVLALQGRRQPPTPCRAPCRRPALVQIAVRTCQAEAGQLEEVAFLLFGQETMDAWVAAARALGLQEEGAEAGGAAKQEL